MLENSVYSVITPEGCASILWRSADQAQEAAEAMRLTAEDLKKLEIVDEVIPEPLGGAHRGPEETIKALGEAMGRALDELAPLDAVTLIKRRRQKFLDMGQKGL